MIKEWMIANPKLSIVLISVIVTLAITLVTKKFTDQERMKELKKTQKKCSQKLKENREDKDAIQQNLECSLEMMKHSFRPMLITIIPLLILFWFLRDVYNQTALAEVSFIFPIWLWWYIGAGIISSLVLRKLLKVA